MNRDEIIAANPLVDYCRARGWDPRRDGANGRWKCRCPFHDERTPSFTIYEKEDRCHCFGCGFDGTVIDVHMRDRGIDVGEAMRDLGGGGNRDHGKKPKEVAFYPYVDENGIGLFHVIRYEDKTFKQCRIDAFGDRDWTDGKGNKGMGDCRRVVYRLPSVIAATTIFVVEGEKDVHTMEAIGRVATCNPGGASKPGDTKWRKEYNDTFFGKNVVIIPDRDDAGRVHGENVASNLVDVAARVSIIDLPKGSKDISEFAAVHGARFAEAFGELEGGARIHPSK